MSSIKQSNQGVDKHAYLFISVFSVVQQVHKICIRFLPRITIAKLLCWYNTIACWQTIIIFYVLRMIIIFISNGKNWFPPVFRSHRISIVNEVTYSVYAYCRQCQAQMLVFNSLGIMCYIIMHVSLLRSYILVRKKGKKNYQRLQFPTMLCK